ncbi:MAG: hypothetical protein ABL876_15475, partial [Chitinophagaceae bacterium]
DLSKQKEFYLALIKRVGVVQAQDELFFSGLPFDGQTHLLNHVVGDYLYETYGTKGLPYCRDYFLSSCYHGFVLNVIADGGMDNVADTFNECVKEGPTVYTQCAHGIGHGFLAHAGYKNLTKALHTCDQAIENIENFPAFNCYDGVFMENIWAVHNGKPSPERWVKETDLLYPCNDKRIDAKYLGGCFANQPALIAILTKGDIKKIADICFDLDQANLKETCMNGLARQIHPIVKGEVKGTFYMCSLMPTLEWQNYCITANAVSAYSVGDRENPFILCGEINSAGENICYEQVFSMMAMYKKTTENTKKLCSKIFDRDWRSICEKRF